MLEILQISGYVYKRSTFERKENSIPKDKKTQLYQIYLLKLIKQLLKMQT